MSYLQSTVCALLLTIAAGLTSPTFAGISFGYYGGHHGGHGYRIGLHHGHHGLYGRHGYYGRRHYRHRYYGRYYRRHGGYPRYRHRYYDPYYSRGGSHTGRSALYTSRRHSAGDNSGEYQTDQEGHQQGWTVLADGDYGQALSFFGREAQANPEAGLPKAGYAIAVASSGDLDKGVWAMRRAFRYEPDTLSLLVDKTALHPAIDELIARYEYVLQEEGIQRDEAFMVAALNYLKGDREAAGAAASLAAENGDTSRSFENLSRLLASGSSEDNNY